MDSHNLSLRQSAASLLFLLAVAGAGPVAAGMFATEAAVSNFTFVDGNVEYSTPPIGEVAVALSPDNAVVLKVRNADGSRSVFDPESGFTAKLNLGAKMTSGTAGVGSLLIFGSIPSAQDSDSDELMSGTLDAMQGDEDAGSLAFLVPDQPTTGTLAQQYQSIGIYAHPAGSDPVDWARQSTARLGSILDTPGANLGLTQEPSPTAAIPTPATALLILAGVFGLAYRQRRAKASHGA